MFLLYLLGIFKSDFGHTAVLCCTAIFATFYDCQKGAHIEGLIKYVNTSNLEVSVVSYHQDPKFHTTEPIQKQILLNLLSDINIFSMISTLSCSLRGKPKETEGEKT